MVEAVALALVDELAAVPRQEYDGMLGLNVFGVCFLDEGGHQLACLGIVLAEFGMVLVAVQLDEVEASGIRGPTDVSEITVGRVACIQIDALLRFGVVDAYGHLVARHACHRIADIVHFAYPCGDVYQRVLRHHAFVHAVEGEQVALRTPVSSFADAELVAVYALPAYDAVGFVGYGSAIHEEVVLEGIGHVAACGMIILVGAFFWEFTFADNLVRFPVVDGVASGQADEYLRFVGPGQSYLIKVAQFAQLFLCQSLIDFLACYE